MEISPNNTQMNPEKIETLKIEQDNVKYLLLIKISGDNMELNLSETEDRISPTYSRKITLNEIKNFHNLFSYIKSCSKFFDYLKSLSEQKKLIIQKSEGKMIISFIVEYLLEKDKVEIELFPNKLNVESIVLNLSKEIKLLKEKINIFEKENQNIKNENTNTKNEIKDLKNEIHNLKNENTNTKNEIKDLKNEIQNLQKDNTTSKSEINDLKNENINLKNEIKEIKNILEPINKKYQEKIRYNKSVIMKENEFKLINDAIKSRLNKEIKELKKLYQASIDGDGAMNFHSKCDNIPNTLVVIESAGNRRFGGFTTQFWESHSLGKYKDDKNAFLFSLDKQKIYSYKNDGKAIYCSKNYGPCFGSGATMFLSNNALKGNNSYTYESYSCCSYNFNGDNNALSEDGRGSDIYAKDYEVFQVLFS